MRLKYPFLLVAVLLIGSLAQMPVQAAGEAPGGIPVLFNESVPGERNMGQVFTWSIQNVSNQADVMYHFTVYDYRLIGPNYSYYSPAWGQWFTRDAAPGFQYLVIWIRSWSEGTACWGYGPERFRVWAWGNLTIDPEPVQLQDLPVRFKSDTSRPVVIRELENRTMPDGVILTTERYGWKDGEELTRLEPGDSSAWEGVILYQIPQTVGPEDLRVAGWFGYYGTPVWYLTPHKIRQQSYETWWKEQRDELSRQIASGLRTSDRQAGRSRG